MCHCESVDSGPLDTSVESFDRHFAVNARATWLLIRELGLRFRGAYGSGRIISLTSDYTVHNLPYGASKGALDRITLATAQEFANLGLTANAINPGPVDIGWMSGDLRAECMRQTPGRLGTPQDTAHLAVSRANIPHWSAAGAAAADDARHGMPLVAKEQESHQRGGGKEDGRCSRSPPQPSSCRRATPAPHPTGIPGQSSVTCSTAR